MESIPVMVMRRGEESAGAIFIKINGLGDGNFWLFGPAPSFLHNGMSRVWRGCFEQMPTDEETIDTYIAKQLVFDPDIWIIEVEDKQGRNFLQVEEQGKSTQKNRDLSW
jgi:hypothetical protein